VLQAEFSLTQVLDKPVTGRIFFEQVIRDNLDIGRPDRVGLIFGRRIMRTGPRATPGRFRTRVITSGVVPTLHIDYKHSKIKQYHKEGKALRTETTINDPGDFGRVGIGEVSDDRTTKRMAHQNEWTALPDLLEGLMQLKIYLSERSGFGPRIARSIAGPIVAAYSRDTRDLLLNEKPVK